MGLNLGQINFGINAETQALQNAVKAFQRFGQTVNSVASGIQNNSNSVAVAFRKQEAAVARALQQVLNYRSAVRSAGAANDTNFLSASTNAFKALQAAMAKGQLSALDYQRAMERFNASMGNNQRGLRAWKAAQDEANRSSGKGSQLMRELGAAAVFINGPLGGVASRLSAFNGLLKTSNLIIAGFVAGLASGAAGIYSFAKAMIANELAMGQARGMLTGVAGSLENANAELGWTRKLADDAGASWIDLSKQWARFAAAAQNTSLQGDKARQVFTDIAMAAGQARMGSVEFEGVMRALEQMLSKGNVQAEELRGQLGDRLPGAFRIAADSMGVTTRELNKMLKAGQVGAETFLPAFAKGMREAYGATSLERVQSLTASIARMNNSWTSFLDVADKTIGASKGLMSALDSVAKGIDWMSDNIREVLKIIGAVAAAITAYFVPALAMMVAGPVISGITALVTGFYNLAKAIAAANTVMAASAFMGKGGALMMLARIAVALGAAVVGYQAMDAMLGQLDGSMGKLIQNNGMAADSTNELTNAQKKLQNMILNLKEEIAALWKNTDMLGQGTKVAQEMGIVVRGVSDVYRAFEQQASLDEWRNKLMRAGMTAQAASQQVNGLKEAMIANNQANEKFDQTTGKILQANSEIASSFVNGLGAVFRGKSSMMDFFDTFLDKLLEILVLQPLIDALSQSLNSMMGQGGAPGGSTFFGNSLSALFAHTGAIAGSKGGSTRSAPALAFAGAQRLHSGGFAANEVPAVLKRKEGVFTPQQMDNANSLIGALAGRGSGTVVNVSVSGVPEGHSANVNEQDNGSGGKDIEIMITRIVAKGIRNPQSGISKAMTSRGVGYQQARP